MAEVKEATKAWAALRCSDKRKRSAHGKAGRDERIVTLGVRLMTRFNVATATGRVDGVSKGGRRAFMAWNDFKVHHPTLVDLLEMGRLRAKK